MIVDKQHEFIAQQDREVADAMDAELKRQRANIELIASENIVSPAVLAAVGSVLTNTPHAATMAAASAWTWLKISLSSA